jgi:elongation factor P
MKATDIKRGTVVEYQGKYWQVRDLERSAPTGRGGNTTFRFTLYLVGAEQKVDVSLRADDELTEAELIRRDATFSYMDGDNYVFMDTEDYTQYTLSPAQVGELPLYSVDGNLKGLQLMLIDGEPVGLKLPPSVELEVVDTAPYVKGASATGRAKPAKLATGLEIAVPEYIENGVRVKVNTETGEYSGRA